MRNNGPRATAFTINFNLSFAIAPTTETTPTKANTDTGEDQDPLKTYEGRQRFIPICRDP